ncbi:MAG: ATP-binding protein [Candidatus Nanopelagicales bacterium]
MWWIGLLAGGSALSRLDGDESGVDATPAPELLDPAVTSLVRELPGIVLLVDGQGMVTHASSDALTLRLVRRSRLAYESLRDCALKTLANGTTQQFEVSLRRPPMRKLTLDLRVRGIPLAGDHVLLMMTDTTEERRLLAVRRDFIANVSHELKTPVGAMSLLSEALVAARDDPEAVEHFAHRMQSEATRLAQLINDVIDLSRVQGDDPLSHAQPVSVDALVRSSTEFVRNAAEAKGIQVVVGGEIGEQVYGDAAQLETALRNVLTNAVTYSEPGTRVAVAVRTSPLLVELDVKDQGMGIPDGELDRIFERFYRVDEARSRVTGGTGLGLSIVRNVCRNHGGDCLVWSVENEGSTFTLQLPRMRRTAPDEQEEDDAS